MYANGFMQNFAPTQTVTGHILDKNPVPPNIKGKNLLEPYLRELMVNRTNIFP